MPKPDPDTIKRLIEEVTSKLADDGRLIEGGFAALRLLTIPDDAPDAQVTDMRTAYFAGAQHVWGSLFGILDGGTEPTERDLLRMSLIHDELQKFFGEMRAETDPRRDDPSRRG